MCPRFADAAQLLNRSLLLPGRAGGRSPAVRPHGRHRHASWRRRVSPSRRSPSQRIHPHRPDGNRYRGHAAHTRQQHTPHTDTTRGVQRTAARTAKAAQQAAMARSIGALQHPHGPHGVSAGSRSARGGRSQCKRTSEHSTRHPAASHSVCTRAQVVRHVATSAPRGTCCNECATLHLLQRVRHVAPVAAVG
jgi:hypothetical protein